MKKLLTVLLVVMVASTLFANEVVNAKDVDPAVFSRQNSQSRDFITIFEEDFIVIDKSEKDITNRGIDSTMSMDDKINNFLRIKEIPDELRGEYLLAAKEIINSI